MAAVRSGGVISQDGTNWFLTKNALPRHRPGLREHCGSSLRAYVFTQTEFVFLLIWLIFWLND